MTDYKITHYLGFIKEKDSTYKTTCLFETYEEAEEWVEQLFEERFSDLPLIKQLRFRKEFVRIFPVCIVGTAKSLEIVKNVEE